MRTTWCRRRQDALHLCLLRHPRQRAAYEFAFKSLGARGLSLSLDASSPPVLLLRCEQEEEKRRPGSRRKMLLSLLHEQGRQTDWQGGWVESSRVEQPELELPISFSAHFAFLSSPGIYLLGRITKISRGHARRQRVCLMFFSRRTFRLVARSSSLGLHLKSSSFLARLEDESRSLKTNDSCPFLGQLNSALSYTEDNARLTGSQFLARRSVFGRFQPLSNAYDKDAAALCNTKARIMIARLIRRTQSVYLKRCFCRFKRITLCLLSRFSERLEKRHSRSCFES